MLALAVGLRERVAVFTCCFCHSLKLLNSRSWLVKTRVFRRRCVHTDSF